MREGPVERGASLTGLRRYTWWTVPGTMSGLLVLLLGAWILDGDQPAWARGPAVPALAVLVTVCVVLLGRRMATGRPIPVTTWLVMGYVAAFVLAVLPLVRRDYGLWAVAPSAMAAVTAAYLPGPRRWRFLGAAMALSALPGPALVLSSGDGSGLAYAALFPPGLVAFTAWVTLGPLWAWDVAGRLNEARGLAAELAVKDERLRFAADLHDIQGHHLQVIALKSELAARLAETDPARAATEMREVRRLAAEALRDTRAVVLGYRRTTLDEEIANATKVLAAAGIDARAAAVDTTGGPPEPDAARHLLGLVMREATTNVLRHSRARHAEVEYRLDDGHARLRVSNDGADEPPPAPGPSGTGLAGLAERLGGAGGDLTWEHQGGRFVLTATLPVAGPVAQEQVAQEKQAR